MTHSERQVDRMNKLRVGSVLLSGLLIAGMSGLVMAGGGHGGYVGYGGHSNVGVRVVVDPFLFMPGYYPSPYYYPGSYYPRSYFSPYYFPPYYYPPAAVTVPTEPPVYIERRETVEPAPQNTASWYYCADPQGYYPYVEQCPGGWQAVAPRPPASPEQERLP